MHKLHNLIDRRIQNPPPIVHEGAYRASLDDTRPMRTSSIGFFWGFGVD